MSIITLKGYYVCCMLLLFILIRFCKRFCCLRLYISYCYWAIDQLVFTLARNLVSPTQAKLDQDIDKFYLIKMTITHFICSYWKPAWFEKLYQLSIAIVMGDSQVASTKRLHVFCRCCSSLSRKNTLSVQCS